MFKSKRIILLLPLLLWLLTPLSDLLCQLHNIRIPFENLTTKDGLVANQVNCIVKDSMGFYWYGTSLGLNRHDGHHLETFRNRSEDIYSIPHDNIASLLVVNQHAIAGLTSYGQLFIYDYRDAKHNRIFRIPTHLDHEVPFKAEALASDGTDLYAIDSKGNILVIDIQQRTVSAYILATQPEMEDPHVLVFLKGNLWVGAENGLFQVDTGTCMVHKIDLSFYTDQPEGKMSVRVIEPMDDHHYILSSHRSSRYPFKGLIKFDHVHHTDEPLCLSAMGKSFDAYPIDILKKIGPSQFFFRIHNLSRLVYDINTHEWDTLSIRPNHTKYLTTASLNCVYSDGDGRYRIGSNQGVFIYFPETHMFKEYYPQTGAYQARQWTGMYLDEIKSLIVATSSGIKNYVPQTDAVTTYAKFPVVAAHHKRDQQPSLIRLDSNRMLVLSSYLYTYDIYTHELHLLEPDTLPIPEVPLRSNLFPYIVDGPHCYFVRDGRLYQFHMVTEELQMVQVSDSSAQEVNFDASGLCFDTSGHLWMTTYNHGLVRIDLAQHKAVFCKPSHRVCAMNDLWIDSTNTAWLATSGCGLVKVNIQHLQEINYQYYDVDAGYITSDLNQIMEDDFGRIWSTSRYGINYFEKETGNIYNFSKLHGIEYPHNLFRGKTKDANGNIYVSGGINIIRITPSAFVHDDMPPPVYIKQFQINNQPVTAFWKDTSITLKDKENNFAFEIAAINHIHPKLAKYKYRMEGFHTNWIHTTTEQLIIPFNNLPPGKYTFKAIAANHQGTWNNKGITIQIRILPPMVETFWFRVLILSCILAILHYVYKQRTQRLLAIQRIDIERKLALEAERSRISRDMHDDLGSGLSAIHLMSNYLKESTASKYPEFSEDIEKIRKSSEDLNQRIREIIWTVNTKDDTLESLVLFLHRYAHEMSETSRIPIHVHAPEAIPDISLDGMQRKHLFHAVKEAVNNAIKHGHPTQIDIDLQTDVSKEISLVVRDNGQGFNPEHVNGNSSGNGMSNMKYRMSEIGGQMEVHTSDKGTSISFSIKA